VGQARLVSAATEEREQVRRVLSLIKPRDAELLLLRGNEFQLFDSLRNYLDKLPRQ
jgi:hypothetical protein